MRTPHVVLVGNCPPPWGGISRHLADLADLLRRARLPHEILDLDSQRRRQRTPSLLGGVILPASRFDLAARLIQAGVEGDLVHLHTNGHNLQSWVLAWLAGIAPAFARLVPRRKGAAPRHLLTVHSGLAPDYLLGHRSPASSSVRWRSLWLRLTSELFAKVICVNPAIAAALREIGVDPDRLLVLPAFSPRSVRVDRRKLPAALLEQTSDAPLVGATLAYGHGYGREYGAEVFFSAMAKLAADPGRCPVHIVVIGPGTDGPGLRRLAAELGLSDRTLFLGELDHGAALATLARLDVFVRPSLADGDAISVREALTLGRPTVATQVGHRPAGALLVPPGDADALARRVAAVLDDPSGHGAGTQHVFADPLPRLLSLYRELLPSGARAPSARAPSARAPSAEAPNAEAPNAEAPNAELPSAGSRKENDRCAASQGSSDTPPKASSLADDLTGPPAPARL